MPARSTQSKNWKILIIIAMLALLASLAFASIKEKSDIILTYSLDSGVGRDTLNKSGLQLTSSVRTGTQPHVLDKNEITLDLMQAVLPPIITDTRSLFNWSSLKTEVVWAALSLILNNSNGTIDFETTIDLSNVPVLDLDSNVNISHNYVKINGSAIPQFNRTAKITITNLTFSNIRVLKDGSDCVDCTIVSYSNSNLIFTAPGFTVYQAADGSILPAIRISTRVNVTNATMNLSGSAYNSSYPSSVTIDIGNDGIAEWNFTGQLNSTEQQFTNFTGALNSLLRDCSCSSCSLSANGLTCTIGIAIDSRAQGTVLLSDLNISQVIRNATWNSGSSYNLIDLDDYFYDQNGDTLDYTARGNSSIKISISDGVVALNPGAWYGQENITFYANDSINITKSNNVTLAVNQVSAPPAAVPSGRGGRRAEEIEKPVEEVKEKQYLIDFSTETTREIEVSEGDKIILRYNEHYKYEIEVKKVGSVELAIAAIPYYFKMEVGETINVDLNMDGIYDVAVTLKKMYDSKAWLIISKLKGTDLLIKGIKAKEKMPLIRVTPQLIKVSMRTDEVLERQIEISNINEASLFIDFDIIGLKGIIEISEQPFILEPGQIKTAVVKFDTSNIKPGVYTGEIIVGRDPAVGTIRVIVEVESKQAFFDMSLDISAENKEITPGKELIADITIINIYGIGLSNVSMAYSIKDTQGNLIKTEEEMITVEKQASYTKIIQTPDDIKEGAYIFIAEARYEDSVGVASELFNVVERPIMLAPATELIWWLQLIVDAVLVYLIVNIIRSRPKRKADMKKIIKKTKKQKEDLEEQLNMLEEDYASNSETEEFYVEDKNRIKKLIEQSDQKIQEEELIKERIESKERIGSIGEKIKGAEKRRMPTVSELVQQTKERFKPEIKKIVPQREKKTIIKSLKENIELKEPLKTKEIAEEAEKQEIFKQKITEGVKDDIDRLKKFGFDVKEPAINQSAEPKEEAYKPISGLKVDTSIPGTKSVPGTNSSKQNIIQHLKEAYLK